MNRTCVECDALFDPQSREKRKVGGLITHCVDCSVDDTVRYLGVAAGEGKMSNVQVLKFNSNKDREAYKSYWKATSGMNTGKQCSMHFRAKEPAISFETKATFISNPNHKGKA